MSEYKINITNNSGEAQNVAIYQEYPNIENGQSLVWLKKKLHAGNKETFEWNIEWGLTWGTANEELLPGVEFKYSGPIIEMNPTEKNGNNLMNICYDESFKTGEVKHSKELPLGSMFVSTDKSFDISNSKNMNIAVCMDGKPTLAMKGKPNGEYRFDTHPVYYICVTDSKEGVAVSGTFSSIPMKVEFDGETEIDLELTDQLEFNKIEKQK